MRTYGAVTIAAALVIATAGCTSSDPSPAPPGSATPAPWTPVDGQELTEPEQLFPENGLLEVTLRTELGEVDIAGSTIKATPYNDSFTGPTLNLQPGDTLRVTLENRTDEHTNIHYHGLHVSPSGKGDNVLRMMDADSVNESVIHVPEDHETGLFWYHAHMHGNTDEQVYGGMRGLIAIGDIVGTHLPDTFDDITERQFSLNDAYDQHGVVTNAAPNMRDTTLLINGLSQPHWSIAPGETQLWRFANTGADLFYELALDGHTFHVIAEDGSPVWEVWETDRLSLPPGKRLEVLVQGGAPGDHVLETLATQVGPGSANRQPEADLGTVRIEGDPQEPLTIPRAPEGPMTRDLSSVEVDRRRTFTFSMKRTGSTFAFINGEAFDPNRVGVAPKLGSVEEWTLRNPSTAPEVSAHHPFHIHVNDFQVISLNGEPYDAKGLQDVVELPSGGEVVIRQAFEDFTGEFVFHCHILGHEDGGMMQTVKVR